MTLEATMYTTSWCGWCRRASHLLEQRGIPVTEIDIEEAWEDPRERLEALTGQRSVPQIFLGDRHVGGFDELAQLDRSGELTSLVSGG